MAADQTTSVRVTEDVRRRLAQHAGRLSAQSGSRVSMGEAIDRLLRDSAPSGEHAVDPASGMGSQRVTAADRAAGRIRFPRAAKAAFPPEPASVSVELRGVPLTARWDPRVGPDRERSGVLRVGRDTLERL